jgi:hypothetical protein
MDAIFIFFGHPGSMRCLRQDSPALLADGTDPEASSRAPLACCARHHRCSWPPPPVHAGTAGVAGCSPAPPPQASRGLALVSGRQAETSRPRPLPYVHSAQLLLGHDGHVLYVQTVTWKKMIYLRECHRFVVSTVSSS